jgi:hypothetical protein
MGVSDFDLSFKYECVEVKRLDPPMNAHPVRYSPTLRNIKST